MQEHKVDEVVRLTHDVPECLLRKDEVGVVCSIWLAPEAYELEFHHRENESKSDTRVLLLPEQFKIELDKSRGAN